MLSLQFDENFGLYVSAITGDYNWNHVITNRHPLAPNSPFSAARDLMLHSIVTEYLYRYLEIRKQTAKGSTITRQNRATADKCPRTLSGNSR